MKNRILSFDFFKFFACFAVVCIHVRIPIVGDYIAAISKWAVPFFFMVSGYFLLSKDGLINRTKTLHKIKHLLYLIVFAILFYSLYHLIGYCLLQGVSIKSVIETYFTLNSIARFFITNTPFIYQHLWFLFALLYCYLFSLLLNNKIKGKWKAFYIVIAIIVLVLAYEFLPQFKALLELEFANLYNLFFLRALPFFFIGILFREYFSDEQLGKINNLILVFACIAFVVCSVVENLLVGECQFYVSSYILAILVFVVCIKNPLIHNKGLNYIGKNITMYIYVIHVGIHYLVTAFASKFGFDNSIFFPYINTILVFACSLFAGACFLLLNSWFKHHMFVKNRSYISNELDNKGDNKVVSHSRQRGVGIVLQYVQMALNIIISLLTTPIILRILGQNEYGIYNLASSVIAYLSLLSLGFGASYLRFYSIYKKKNDYESISKMNGLYLMVFMLVGIISLLLGLFLAGNVGWFYNESYTEDNIYVAERLMALLAINLAISFPASVFVSYITSQQRFIFLKVVNMGKTILSPTVSIVLLYCGFGSIGMVISTTVISLLIDCLNVFYCFSKLKMKISFKSPNFLLLKDIFVFSIFIAINQLIDQINWQTDKIIIGKFINGAAVAIYAVGANLNTMFTSFSTAVSNVFAPKINTMVSENKPNLNDELTALFIRVGRIQWFILSLVLTGFVFFGQFFISKWAGTGYENSYWVALLLMCPAIVPLIQNIGIEIQRAKNKHKFRSIIYLIMAFINVVLSIFLTIIWGEIGAALGTTISLLVANGLIMNIYYQKAIGIKVTSFWKSILKTLPSYIIPVTIGIILRVLLPINSIFDFLVEALIYAFVFALCIYAFGLNFNEKTFVKNVTHKVFDRITVYTESV